VAKSRAQRKAEKRRRQQAQQQRQPGRPDEPQSPAQETKPTESGDQAEFEAVLETGARTEEYGEHVTDGGEGQAQARAASAAPAPTPEAPAPSTADVGIPSGPEGTVEEPAEVPVDESRAERRDRKERDKEARRKARAKEQQKGAAGVEPQQKQRGAVTGFIASCWAELKKVQWPDRDTLVQASAVTIIFVFVAAAYLGALDAVFNYVVKEILL
jgi:preprotein translocase SecE subunit